MIYAIGDIHGQYKMLKDIYNLIIIDIKENYDKENKIIFLGDYIDRGRENKYVLDFLMTLQDTDELEHIFLFGNHEQIFIDAMEYPMDVGCVNMWLGNGGMNFMTGEKFFEFTQFHAAFPWHHYVNWFKNKLELFHETEDYIFVHGALDVKQPVMELQEKQHLIWGRHTEKDWYKGYPKWVIHGHTPNPEPIIDRNRINVDTSGWHERYGGRRLTAVALQNRWYLGDPRFIQIVKAE